MGMDDRKPGFYVHKVDMDKLSGIIFDKFERMPGEEYEFEQLVLVKARKQDGSIGNAVIITEGVGWFADNLGKFSLPYVHRYAFNEQGYSMTYEDYRVSEDVVLSCVTDEVVELREWIRVFGHRLDNNCYVWQAAMAGVPQEWEVMV
jgi:hypothetical protein